MYHIIVRDWNGGEKMVDLTDKEKRAYAVAMSRVNYGIYGFNKICFRTITLTTKKGTDNSQEKFSKDLNKLFKWMRKGNRDIEYCGCYEYAPRNKLLHWHGMIRVKGGYLGLNQEMISKKWEELHDAKIVDIQYVDKMKYLTKYINKHMIKDYLNNKEINRRVLVSRGWQREGVKSIISDFKKWYEGLGIGMMYSGSYKVLNNMLEDWCKYGIKGKEVIYNHGKGTFVIQPSGRTWWEYK